MVGKRIAILLILIVLASSLSAATVDPLAVTDEIRRTTLDLENTIEVSGLKLNAGLATVVFESGLLVPATLVAGRAVEFVFIGEGRIELEPPDEIEAGQMELFTGSRSMDESFEQAVFVVALDAAAEGVSRGERVVEDAELAKAESVFDEWLAGPERKLLDVEARVFADAVGDGLAAGFFCGSFEGTRLGRFLYVVDPLADEQVTVGQFVAPDLSRREERRARRTIEKAQRRGKLIGLQVSDLGIWDTWLSSNLAGDDGKPAPGTRGVEPTNYDIDAVLRGRKLELEATATIDLRVVVEGLRTVSFEIDPDLGLTRVADKTGRELEWFRSRNELVAVLAKPAVIGDELTICIDYFGNPVTKVASGAWIQRDTTGWYPHTGIIDRATYTLTLHWPRRLDVVAAGAPEDEGEDPDDLHWRRWRLDEPTLGTSFEIGDFDVATGSTDAVTVSVAVDRVGQRAERKLEHEILATVLDVLEYYGEIFGPYPLEHLQVVSSPRGFSQGLLGFVSLSTAAMVDWDIWGAVLGIQDRRTVIAHELAHQWWGNLVGWRGYRDQWISEAMASYAALLWSRNRVESTGDDRLGWGPTVGWQTELMQTTEDGRPVESLGPLVIGVRLDSSISSRAYPAIVYKKGAVILDMLSNLFEEGDFVRILGRLTEVGSGRIISTDDFLQIVGRLGGTDLEWFGRRYVYGTGLPEIKYSYELEELDDGRWAVVGFASQAAPYRNLYVVEETVNGGLDVRRSAEVQLDVTDSVLIVPLQIGFGDETTTDIDARSMLRGRFLVSGESNSFRIEVDREPAIVWLDRDGEVFGRFFAAGRWPKRTSYYRALDLEAAGDSEGARGVLRNALALEVAVIPAGWEDVFRYVDVDAERASLDARIRLALTRLDLDAGDSRGAKIEFGRAAKSVKSRDRWLLDHDLLVVESRLQLLTGDPQSAFKLLEKRVLGRRGIESPETWALLAVAAHQVGDTEVFSRARDRADELGVDLGPLALE